MSLTAPAQVEPQELKARIARFREVQQEIARQVHRVIVGQEEVLEQVMIALFVGGHCLITGLPGTAKTLLVRTMAQTLGLLFKRIQFTPDLMPSDITGTDIIEEDPSTGHRTWTFVKGPIFANVLLADEINRTPPRRSPLCWRLCRSWPARCAATTTNSRPVLRPGHPESDRTGRHLPAARSAVGPFSINTVLDYLSAEEEMQVIDLTTTTQIAHADPVTNAEEILDFQQLVRMVPIGESVARFAVELVRATRASDERAPDFIRKYVNYGGSVRAAQYLVLAARPEP